MKKRSELLFSLILVPIDYFMMVAGFVVAYILRVKIELRPTVYQVPALDYLQLVLLLLPIWILIFALNGLYNLSSTRSRLNELARVIVATGSGVMVLIFIDFFSLRPIFPSKSVPIYGLLFSMVFIFVARLIVRAIQEYMLSRGVGVHNVVILGASPQAAALNTQLSLPKSGYSVVYFSSDKEKINDTELLKSITAKTHVDEIINATERMSDEKLLEIIRFSDENHIAYKYIPSLAGVYRAKVVSSTLAGIPIVEMVRTPLEGWGRIVKRLFDVFFSFFGLIIASPLYLIIAVAITIKDPGKVFYSHKRVGRGGHSIHLYKFRTMREKYSTGADFEFKTPEEAIASFGDPELVEEFRKHQKLKNDPRVSRLGAFLRRTSLDELPQLLNVLKGDISLVGPRPVVTAELPRFGENSAQLLAIRPGLTGLWQVSGRNDISYDERARLELYYVENWSLTLDISILLKTITMLVKGSNGY